MVLFNRYGKASYNLAYFILGDARTAQEAVEETMVQVVQTAQVASPPLNTMSWVMKMTARHSLALTKRRHPEMDAKDESVHPQVDPRRDLTHEESSATMEAV